MLTDDKLKEECGVFGMLHSEQTDVSKYIYYGLSALQHRGQESAGIAVCDTNGPKGNISYHKDMGLVSEVFRPDTLLSLHGDIGIGHVRYSTTGGSCKENAQPLVLNYLKGTLALVHNGNLTNTDVLREQLQNTGAIFHTTTDSEVIAYQIAKERTKTSSIEEAVFRTAPGLSGGYALLIMSPQKLIGVRGTTIANLIHMLKKAGALEVHVRISSPPFLYPCYYGTDVPNGDQLIASSHSCDEICRQIRADSLGYLKLEDLDEMTYHLPLCRACFNNHYPTPIPPS